MSYSLPDHPDIASALRGGYPIGKEPQDYYCGECGERIEHEDEVYEDIHYDYLCKDCLLRLHKKDW